MAKKFVVTVKEIETGVPYSDKEWKKVREDEDKDPSGDNRTYDYVVTEGTKTVEHQVFEQTVDELNLAKLVLTINTPEVKA